MTRRALRLLLAALPLAGTDCTDSSGSYTTSELRSESRTEGEIDVHWAWLDPSTAIVVAPIHASGERARFSRERLDEMWTAPGAHEYVQLSIWRFDAATDPVHLGADGVAIVAEVRGGSIASIAPSNLLRGARDPAARALLASLTGAESLPALAGAGAVEILVVLETAEPPAGFESMRALLPAGPIDLARDRIGAVAWAEFRSKPSREGFEALAATGPVGSAAARDPGGEETDEPND